MYNNAFPMTYPQYLQQQIQQLQNQVPPQPQPVSQNGGSFFFVNNKQEAENWMVNAGQTVFFFDRNASVFYIKTVAQNGLSQPIEVYDYTQRMTTPEAPQSDSKIELDKYVTKDEFEALNAKFEALRKELGDNE